MAEITYHLYSPGDEIGITELLCLVFPKWKNLKDPIANWRWKYLESPNKPDIYLAKDEGKTVGVSHRIILDYKIGESLKRAGYGDDLAVHPDYREQGIWKNLTEFGRRSEEKNHYQLHYMASENPVVKTNFEKIGYKPMKHYLSHLVWIRDREALLRGKNADNVVMNVGVATLTGIAGVKQLLSSGPERRGDFSIVNADHFDNRLDSFWDQVKRDLDYSIVKNARYLNWKHSRPTVAGRKLRLAVSGEKILGFSVLDLRVEGDYREGAISELLALSDRSDVASALIVDACEYFEGIDAAAVYLQATAGHPYDGLAKRSGFIDASIQNKTYFFYRTIGDGVPEGYLESIPPSRVQLSYF